MAHSSRRRKRFRDAKYVKPKAKFFGGLGGTLALPFIQMGKAVFPYKKDNGIKVHGWAVRPLVELAVGVAIGGAKIFVQPPRPPGVRRTFPERFGDNTLGKTTRPLAKWIATLYVNVSNLADSYRDKKLNALDTARSRGTKKLKQNNHHIRSSVPDGSVNFGQLDVDAPSLPSLEQMVGELNDRYQELGHLEQTLSNDKADLEALKSQKGKGFFGIVTKAQKKNIQDLEAYREELTHRYDRLDQGYRSLYDRYEVAKQEQATIEQNVVDEPVQEELVPNVANDSGVTQADVLEFAQPEDNSPVAEEIEVPQERVEPSFYHTRIGPALDKVEQDRQYLRKARLNLRENVQLYGEKSQEAIRAERVVRDDRFRFEEDLAIVDLLQKTDGVKQSNSSAHQKIVMSALDQVDRDRQYVVEARVKFNQVVARHGEKSKQAVKARVAVVQEKAYFEQSMSVLATLQKADDALRSSFRSAEGQTSQRGVAENMDSVEVATVQQESKPYVSLHQLHEQRQQQKPSRLKIRQPGNWPARKAA